MRLWWILGIVPALVLTSPVLAYDTILGWDDVDGETHYKIFRKDGACDGDNSAMVQIGTVGQDVTEYTDVGAPDGVALCYAAKSANNYGDSDFSNQAGLVTPAVPVAPGPPLNFTAQQPAPLAQYICDDLHPECNSPVASFIDVDSAEWIAGAPVGGTANQVSLLRDAVQVAQSVDFAVLYQATVYQKDGSVWNRWSGSGWIPDTAPF